MTIDSVVPPPAEEAVVAPPPPRPEPLRPITASERVETIDILRGMALFGILAANMRGFAGPAITYMMPHLFWPALHDRIAQAFVDTFIQGKFITIFAFLFGVGFAMQFDRAEERGVKFRGRFAWRMILLLFFGLIHGLLIWFGDILLMYALDGLLLMAFRKRRDTTIKVWATILLLLMPLLMTAVFIASQSGAKLPEMNPPTAAAIAKDANTYENGSWAEIASQRAHDAVTYNWNYFPAIGCQVLGIFLIGVLAWRKRVFHPSPESLPRYRRWMWIGLAVGVTGNVAATALRWIYNPPMMPMNGVLYAIGLISSIAIPALSLGYICFVIVICRSEAMRARLRRFAAIGRTALTNYLLQSVIGTLIFYNYGLGFFGDAGPALLLPLTFAIFIAQMYLSPWWLERYRFGPVEWLWRRMTYGGPLAMRREAAIAAPEQIPAAP